MTTLRILPYEEQSGSWQMALDEALLSSVIRGGSLPSLRFYGWNPPCMSIGYFQHISDINISRCMDEGIDVVRRPTGGRAVLHDSEITYSVVLPVPEGRSGSVLETFRMINAGILQGIQSLGVDAVFHRKERAGRAAGENPYCFSSPSQYEILVKGRKVAGAAQMRREGVLLQHGSIPLSVNRGKIASLLNPGKRSAERGPEPAEDQLAGIEELLSAPVDREKLMMAIIGGFEEHFRCLKGYPDRDELELMQSLRKEKYLSDSWTFRR
ncbi:MAG: biotin/lipoate A/B protein ligase family protein [Candidatus Xenobiia bacterium LiM19]